MVLPPVFIAQLADSTFRRDAARRLGGPASSARSARISSVAGRLRRIAAWTLGWTVFQWWAVIGWPSDLSVAQAAAVASAVLPAVAAVVWGGVGRELAARRASAARLVTVRLPLPPAPRAAVLATRRRLPALAIPPRQRAA